MKADADIVPKVSAGDPSKEARGLVGDIWSLVAIMRQMVIANETGAEEISGSVLNYVAYRIDDTETASQVELNTLLAPRVARRGVSPA